MPIHPNLNNTEIIPWVKYISSNYGQLATVLSSFLTVQKVLYFAMIA